MRRANTRGFTLIEILIVIFIMGIITGVAMLSIRENQHKQIALYATELQQALSLAEETAMLQPTLIGLKINNNQLTLYRYYDDRKQWQRVRDHLLTLPLPPSYLHIELVMLTSIKKNKSTTPQIIFAKNGSITPFKLELAQRGEETLVTIQGESNGDIYQIAA